MQNSSIQIESKKGKTLVNNKGIIIEFVGPPGAGKTTSCKYLSDLLQARGLTVWVLQDIKDFIRQMGFGRKLILISRLIIFRTPILLFYILSLAFNRIYSVNSIYRYIRMTLFDLVVKQVGKKRKVDVILLDQWIIQELWSATIFKLHSYDKISKHLSRFYFNTDGVLYLDIDINTSCERLNMRSTKLSRFDRMDAKKRKEELQKYTSYLYQLYKSSDCKQKHLFSGDNSLEKNANLFLQHFDVKFQFN